MLGSGGAAMVDRREATYADLLAAPEDRIAELIDGELFLSPRPAGPHALALRDLAYDLIGPFDRGRGGPGGWFIVVEPEIHLEAERRVLVPDLAGWRRERMPIYPQGANVALAPDWVAELLSQSTARLDRLRKLPLYAAHGVGFVWLVDAVQRTLEVYRREPEGYLLLGVHADDARVRAPPFEAIELELGALWRDLPQPE